MAKPSKEARAIQAIHINYINREPGAGEVILEDLDFYWTHEDQRRVVEMWGHGYSLGEIGEEIDRDGDELGLLLIHLARNERITNRKRGLKGN